MSKRQRTTFAKSQRERARMDKAAEKRARRLARRRGTDSGEVTDEGTYGPLTPPADRDTPESV